MTTIEIDPASTAVDINGQVNFSATGKDQFGEELTLTNPAWSISGDGDGVFDATSGITTTFTPSYPGSTVVTCTQDGVSATADLEITGDAPRLAAIELNPAETQILVGAEIVFTAAGSDQYGRAFELTSPLWSIAGTGDGVFEPAAGVATVFTASYPGAVVVTCLQGDVSGTADVEIIGDDPRLDAIELSPTETRVPIGAEIEFTATGSDQYGRAFELAEPAWRIEGDGGGTFDPAAGNATTSFTATAVGSAEIVCSDDGVEGSAELTIAPQGPPAPRKAKRRVTP